MTWRDWWFLVAIVELGMVAFHASKLPGLDFAAAMVWAVAACTSIYNARGHT